MNIYDSKLNYIPLLRNTCSKETYVPYNDFPEGFNVGFIEYNNKNKKMAHHSDCSLDLTTEEGKNKIGILLTEGENIFIEFKDKITKETTITPLEINKLFIFTVQKNFTHTHTIKGKNYTMITLYYSITKFDETFHKADEKEREEFFKMRKLENTTIGFKYGEIKYYI